MHTWNKDHNLAAFMPLDKGEKSRSGLEIVIPITAHCYRDRGTVLWVPGDPMQDLISREVARELREVHCMKVTNNRAMLEMTLCRTIYKMQGSTLPYVILQLNRTTRPVVYKEIYMAASRVTDGKNFKIMPLHNSKGLEYLKDLEPDLDVLAFFEGIIDNPTDPQPWNRKLTLARVKKQIVCKVRPNVNSIDKR